MFFHFLGVLSDKISTVQLHETRISSHEIGTKPCFLKWEKTWRLRETILRFFGKRRSARGSRILRSSWQNSCHETNPTRKYVRSVFVTLFVTQESRFPKQKGPPNHCRYYSRLLYRITPRFVARKRILEGGTIQIHKWIRSFTNPEWHKNMRFRINAWKPQKLWFFSLGGNSRVKIPQCCFQLPRDDGVALGVHLQWRDTVSKRGSKTWTSSCWVDVGS